MDNAHAPSNETGNTQADTADAGACNWDRELSDLYVQHFGNLVGELTRRFGNATVAEDAVQDAFIAFHTKAVTTAPGREVAYLAKAARNNVLMWLRTEGRRNEIVVANAPVSLRSPSAEHDALLTGEAEQWSSDIADLPEQQATVITLRHLVGLSVTETADELGVSAGTVKTHTYRGIRNLRDAMAPPVSIPTAA